MIQIQTVLLAAASLLHILRWPMALVLAALLSPKYDPLTATLAGFVFIYLAGLTYKIAVILFRQKLKEMLDKPNTTPDSKEL